MAEQILVTCSHCGGSGIEPGTESDVCLECRGAYVTLPPDRDAVAQAWLESLGGKIDAIIAEQASQREDLTEALTQIWNKVKNL